MNDPSGLPSALGIEAVEWFPQEGGGDTLTVRITGRWRRRRPASTAQPMLVVEVHGFRHRYPAMPEPPSLTGTAPGTWRMTFSVPAWIAPHLGTRASLQLGGVVIPLPGQLERVDPEPEPEAAVAHELRELELHVQAARRRTREAEDRADALAGRVKQVEAELVRSRSEPERLRAELADRERAVRAAEQRAFSERQLREELQSELGLRVRELADAEGPRAELAVALARVHELELELTRVRRAVDEAEHVAAAARAARGVAERRVVEQRVARGIRGELAVAIRTPSAPSLLTPPRMGEARGLVLERRVVAARGAVVSEADVSVRSEPIPVARAGDELDATLVALGEELRELRAIAGRERAGHERARARIAELERQVEGMAARCSGAYDAIAQLRGVLDEMRTAFAAVPPAEPAETSPPATGPIEAERLEAALSRLREAAPAVPDEPVASRATRPWLAPVLRRMLERDAAAAARLVLALLPAQRLVARRPLAYDLVLAEDGCVQVTVAGDYGTVERADAPRPADAVQFAVITDLPGLARFALTGKARGALRRSRARVTGDRDAARALPALLSEPLSLSQLVAAGVVLDPPLALSVAALMIEPAWTEGERFTIAYGPDSAAPVEAHLEVCDGEPARLGEGAPPAPPAATIVCGAESLPALLAGETVADAQVGPDRRPLTLVQEWIKRAQCG